MYTLAEKNQRAYSRKWCTLTALAKSKTMSHTHWFLELHFICYRTSTQTSKNTHRLAHGQATKRAHRHLSSTRTGPAGPLQFSLVASEYISYWVGQNPTYIRNYGVDTLFLAGKLPYIRSYTVYIYGSGQP
jgi:hypothetical protein